MVKMADHSKPDKLVSIETDGTTEPPASEDIELIECMDKMTESSNKAADTDVPYQDLGQPITPTSEGRLTPGTDNSSQSEVSKSCSGSGRVTPVSQSDLSFTWSSSEKNTPVRKKRKKGRHIEFDTPSTSSESGRPHRVPTRPGIIWRKGERIEAMDFMHKWYPAKIVDINKVDEEVLIHFEGWNQRYDEWVKMSSDRVGPATRHSDRKYTSRREKVVHKVGEKVYAKWTDCKMYPARINKVLPLGAYEVVFYDGFKRVVQSINISEIPGEKQAQQPKLPIAKNVEKEKTHVKKPKEVTKKKPAAAATVTPATPSEPPTKQAKVTPKVPKLKKTGKKEVKVKLAPRGRRREALKERSRDKGRVRAKKSKLIIAGSFLAKPEKEEEETPEQTMSVLLPVKSEPVSTQTEYSDGKISETELVGVPGNVKIEVKLEVPTVVPEVAVPTNKLPQPSIPIISLQTVVPPKAFVVEPDHNQYKCVFEGCTKEFRKEHLLDYHVKYYHMEDNRTSTPQAGCKRKRRKTTSICSTDSETSGSSKQPAAKKHRHVSAESFLVIPVPGTAEVKTEVQSPVQTEVQSPVQTDGHKVLQEVQMEESLTQTPIRTGETTLHDISTESVQELRHQRTPSQDTTATEDSLCTEVEDMLERDEVVNCICEYFEENGLMIQCEVCMCWQHASCFGITDRTLPKKYVCFVCENPPGVRGGSRFLHEQDWFKSGRISTFGYLSTPSVSEERSRSIKATHSLVADIHHLNRVLHSLKLQLKILRSKDEKELQLWRVNWDAEEIVDAAMETSMSPVHSPSATADCKDEVTVDNTSSDLTHCNVDLTVDNTAVCNQRESKIETESKLIDPCKNVAGDDTCLNTDVTVNASSKVEQKETKSDTLSTDSITTCADIVPAVSNTTCDDIVPTDSTTQSDLHSDTKTGKLESSDNTSATAPAHTVAAETTERDRNQDTNTQTDSSDLTGKPDVVNSSESTQTHISSESTQTHISSESAKTQSPSESAKTQSSSESAKTQVSTESAKTQSSSESDKTQSSSESDKTQSSSESDKTQSSSESAKTECSEANREDIPTADVDKELEENIHDDTAASDSTESVLDEDPAEVCERNLLQHIVRIQTEIANKLDMIDEQVSELESREATFRGEVAVRPKNVLSDVPLVKRTLRRLNTDLSKIAVSEEPLSQDDYVRYLHVAV